MLSLQEGSIVKGKITGIKKYGAFVKVGEYDGLVHISKMSNTYVKDPTDIVSVGDIVDCYVIDINEEKEKVSLSLVEG